MRRAAVAACAVAMSSSGMLDVLVARIAPGFAFASSAANSARLASRFSKIASMMTSARATPSPATSGIRRSVGVADAARILAAARAKSFAARAIAGASRSAFWSCSVTVRPRSAHHAAMSPPIVPAPTTCTCAALKSPSLPSDFKRSCSPNTRIRLAAVGVFEQRRDRRRVGRRVRRARCRRTSPTGRGSRTGAG